MGCSLLVILRPVKGRGENYDGFKLIGEAYIHGISEGDAMSDLEKGLYKTQTFSLM